MMIREILERPLSPEALKALEPLGREFYLRPTGAVARDMLGKLLVRPLPEGLVAVRLTEVEAYLGVRDPAAHTYNGRRTKRTRAMWGQAGRLYVYFTYGMHYCANVVTREEGVPQAVLLRGAVAVQGHKIMLARRKGKGGRQLLDGPAKICQALGINGDLYGADLVAGNALWLADDGLACPKAWRRKGPRVGVSYAGEAARWPLRLWLALAESS